MNKEKLIPFLKDCTSNFELDYLNVNGQKIPKYCGEFWTSKQRQASSIHEVSYRACFKPQLPRFFVSLLTKENDIVYDPFSGRGTTVLEAGLMGRRVIANDINPLSKILSKPRFSIPTISAVEERLLKIPIDANASPDIDLTMFYHPQTEREIISLKNYLLIKERDNALDFVDDWIRMVATNRLTGHSTGFFSVYTLPPNQAVSQERQIKINAKRQQIPEYRSTGDLILKKSRTLISRISSQETAHLETAAKNALFLSEDARYTREIDSNSIQLTVTSPPFLDVVQYSNDNWLRCWFNGLDDQDIAKKITMSRNVTQWSEVMGDVFKELFRITKKKGWVAFEVGEIKKGLIKLEEHVVPLGLKAGFTCEGIFINEQTFTKTSNIWGIDNNSSGTNSNRIVLFKKDI